jgi:hypothetical protein
MKPDCVNCGKPEGEHLAVEIQAYDDAKNRWRPEVHLVCPTSLYVPATEAAYLEKVGVS